LNIDQLSNQHVISNYMHANEVYLEKVENIGLYDADFISLFNSKILIK